MFRSPTIAGRNKNLSRRSFIKKSTALGVAGAAASISPPFISRGFALTRDPQTILDEISVKNYVREDYQELYKMSGDPIWDPAKDWIRTVDWEAVREAQAGKTTIRRVVWDQSGTGANSR